MTEDTIKTQAETCACCGEGQAMLVRICNHCGSEYRGKQEMRPQADEGLRADAARYRWLRERWGYLSESYESGSAEITEMHVLVEDGWEVDPESLDRAIDKAMKESQE